MPYLLPQTRSTFLVNPQAQDTRPATRQSPGTSHSCFVSQQGTEGTSSSGRNSVRRKQGVATPVGTMGSVTSSYSAAMHRKSRPTCTVSLAHVSAVASPSSSASSTPRALQGIDADAVHIDVDSIAPQVQIQAEPANAIPAPPARRPSKKHLKKSIMNEINVIPFPTSAQTPSPISASPFPSTRRSLAARPLPTPPTHHALLRTTTSRQRENPRDGSSFAHKPPATSMPAPPRKRVRKASASRPIVFARTASGSSSSSSKSSTSSACSGSSSRSSSESAAESSSSISSVSSITSIEESQDENDKLMQMLDIPPRPASPTPQVSLQDQRLQQHGQADPHVQRKREPSDPPPYSTLPPPYSDVPVEKKLHQEGVAIEVEIVAPKPSRPASSFVPSPSAPSASPSSSSSSTNNTRRIQRIPPSELRVLVQLYRTLVHGLEVRYRADSASSVSTVNSSSHNFSYSSSSPAYGGRAGPSYAQKEKERERPSRRVLGPRRTPVVPPTPSTSPIKPSSVRASISIPSSTVSRFPLVEDDDDSAPPLVFASPIPVMGSSIRNPHADRSPRRSPYVSPSSSPPPRSRPCSPTPPPKKEKRRSKETLAAALDVQDALLAIRLRGFLKAQGVQEGDLEVYVEETGATVGGEGKTREERERDELGALIDEYAMDTEDEEDGKDKAKEVRHRREGPLVEDEDDVPVSSPQPPPRRKPAPLPQPLSASPAPSQRLSSPPPQPPTSPTLPPGEHKPVVATPRMIALLTMRHRYTVAARRASEVRAKEREKEREAGLEREFGGKDKAVDGGTGRKGRKSGLRVVWVEEQEEEVLVEDW